MPSAEIGRIEFVQSIYRLYFQLFHLCHYSLIFYNPNKLFRFFFFFLSNRKYFIFVNVLK